MLENFILNMPMAVRRINIPKDILITDIKPKNIILFDIEKSIIIIRYPIAYINIFSLLRQAFISTKKNVDELWIGI